MGYQALLFCPDEKTARTVSQVLSELDFEVVPCTEPFAAVKKLMGEHFDAVVVDCDNEQNATLLFKSARNSPNNHSALAVAVVEGQAGVAKAFRIGANLVLTKPINVEQAKGTLRVARGLLRKNESAKPAGIATTATAKSPTEAPTPAKPTLVPSVAASRPAAPVTPLPAPSTAPQSSFSASASSGVIESAESKESANATPKPAATPNVVSIAASEAKPGIARREAEIPVAMKTAPSITSSSGAASAAAPAREETESATDAPSIIPEPPVPVEKGATGTGNPVIEETALPATTFTFGGAVESGTESASGGSKKGLIAVVAIALIAAAGYVAWTQMPHPSGSATTSSPAPARLAEPAVSQSQPSTAAIAAPPAPTSPTSEIPASAVVAKSTKSAKATETMKISSAPDAPKDHHSNTTTEVATPKPAEAAVAENKAPATLPAYPAIVVKKSNAEIPLGKTSATDAPMPSITALSSAGSGGALPNLLGNRSNVPAPVLQTLSVSQGVSQGLAIKKTQPSYPTNALRMRIEGSVQLLATISKRGDISAVKILSGDPSLARAAADAVKQWKYKPYLLDGTPVEIQTQVTVNFKLPR